MRRLGPILLGTIPLWLAGAALAQATPEGAAELQQSLTTITTPLEVGRDGDAHWEGAWVVEPDGAGYRVTWPALSGSLKEGGAAGPRSARFRCAPDHSVATRLSEGVYRLHSAAPSDCVLKTGHGGQSFRFSSRTRREDNVVDLTQAAFTEWSALLEDVTIQAGGAPATPLMSAARLESSGRGMPSGHPGRRDLVVRSVTEALRLTGPDGTERFTASRVESERHLFDYAFDGVVKRTMETMRMVDLVEDQQRDPASPQIPIQALLSFARAAGSYGDRFRSSTTYSDYRATVPGGSFGLKTLSWDTDAEGIGSESGSGRATLRFSGLWLGSTSTVADWTPQDVTLALAATGVPFKSLLKAIESDPTPAVMPRLAALLGQAGSRLEIETAQLRTAAGGALDLRGSIRADATAARGVSGSATARLTGLAPLAAFLRSRPQTTRTADRVTAVEALGRAVDLGGDTARDYDIVLGGEPALLVNGIDPAVILQDAKP
ncbi:hypothetical protein QFZ27_000082 [Inquilinus ginsengisoli]|uniref:hypothetical protein n=1 Tax=Inquilinus ginsengisoli TaxID=363840 RepID=UPI003D23E469